MRRYLALIEEGEAGYSAVFPDVPGVITTGETFEDVMQNAREALALHLDGEETLPPARTLRQIKETWAEWPQWQRDADFTAAYIDLVPLEKTVEYAVA